MAIATAPIVGSRVFLADLMGDTIRLHLTISGVIKMLIQGKVKSRVSELTGDEELYLYVGGDEKSHFIIQMPVDQKADFFNDVYFIEIV